ncbi:MAG: hypothetical protein RIE06_24755 [Roseibium album]|uniref:hypothetical protein n=1 Tax=Roseibium album TaxID=311410 RepID=UPI0032EFA867
MPALKLTNGNAEIQRFGDMRQDLRQKMPLFCIQWISRGIQLHREERKPAIVLVHHSGGAVKYSKAHQLLDVFLLFELVDGRCKQRIVKQCNLVVIMGVLANDRLIPGFHVLALREIDRDRIGGIIPGMNRCGQSAVTFAVLPFKYDASLRSHAVYKLIERGTPTTRVCNGIVYLERQVLDLVRQFGSNPLIAKRRLATAYSV